MKTLLTSLKVFMFFTILTGILYPLLVTGIAQVTFPTKANGSIIIRNNQTIGSELIGQQFDSTIYFSSRPSAISYHPLPTGGSNYGLSNPKLKVLIAERRHQFVTFNGLDNLTVVPAEMVFASASGLDPHISAQAALIQVNRITKARNFNSTQKQQLLRCIQQHIETPQFFVLGEERVNVLLLNLDVDKIKE